MPEIRLKLNKDLKSLTPVNEKGGVFLTDKELEWVKFAEREFLKAQRFLRDKLHQYGKSIQVDKTESDGGYKELFKILTDGKSKEE
jgi:hypothetical protein